MDANGVLAEAWETAGLRPATVSTSDEFARPTNTTAYAALDAVSDSTTAPTALTFENTARKNGATGYITKARLMTTQDTNTARFRLHLYSEAPTAINDNSPFTVLWANRATRLGFIDFDALTSEGTGSTAANQINTTIRLAFRTAETSRSIFGLLETLDVFNPANGQEFYIELTAEQN